MTGDLSLDIGGSFVSLIGTELTYRHADSVSRGGRTYFPEYWGLILSPRRAVQADVSSRVAPYVNGKANEDIMSCHLIDIDELPGDHCSWKTRIGPV